MQQPVADLPDPSGEAERCATARGLPDDPADRIAALVGSIADFQLENESLWRAVLGASLERWFSQAESDSEDRVPVRGSHRMDAVDVMQWAARALHDAAAREAGQASG